MVSYQKVLEQAQQLSSREKARLLADIGAALQYELHAPAQPKRSLLGIWKEVDLSSADIDEERSNLWGNFPREDIG